MYVSLRWLAVDFPVLESRAFRTIEVSKNDSSVSQYSWHVSPRKEIAKATPTLEPRTADGVLPRTSPGAMGVETESAQVGPSATKLQRPRLGFKPISKLANVEEDSVLTNLAWSFSDPRPRPYLPLSTPLESKRSH